ncbi:hypothetical protein [Lentzea flava]|nr:hypothetical protein [Lentzea flava]
MNYGTTLINGATAADLSRIPPNSPERPRPVLAAGQPTGGQ